MCVCCCTNGCVNWCLECLTSSSSAYPSSGFSEELLFYHQTFPDEKEGNGECKEDEECISVKREHRLRSMSLLRASSIINSNEDIMAHHTSTHNRKQLFNGHGYNLAIYKGHIRGMIFTFYIKLETILMYYLLLQFQSIDI